MAAVTVSPPAARAEQLTRRIRLLVAATITYNLIEATTAITAGILASSTALTGFGLDSVAEVSSAAAVAWQFSARSPAVREAREITTLKITAVSFFALAAYITATSVRALTDSSPAGHSLPGIVLAAASVLVMPLLSAAQRRAGRELGSASAVADSRQTLLCTCLSAVLLAGLLANAVLGWRWADPLAALVIAAAALREGRNAWRGDACCPSPATAQPAPGTSASGRHSGCACCPGPEGPGHSGRGLVEVLASLGEGLSNAQIAAAFKIAYVLT